MFFSVTVKKKKKKTRKKKILSFKKKRKQHLQERFLTTINSAVTERFQNVR